MLFQEVRLASRLWIFHKPSISEQYMLWIYAITDAVGAVFPEISVRACRIEPFNDHQVVAPRRIGQAGNGGLEFRRILAEERLFLDHSRSGANKGRESLNARRIGDPMHGIPIDADLEQLPHQIESLEAEFRIVELPNAAS
jgi:hypothetical protein